MKKKLRRKIAFWRRRFIIRYNAKRKAKKQQYDTDVDGGFVDEWRRLP